MTTHFTPTDQWFDQKLSLPLLIAGPCSAESKEQVISTALEISKIPSVKIYRAGIWKPRTRPSSFEGHGEKALKWLGEVKKETGLLTITEVAHPRHVELILNAGIDMVWIGARTTANPFSVQELVEALKGTNLPVFVKNPVNPDLSLWIGALERLYKAGLSKLAAIHRGFYPFETTELRNIPKWEVALDLKTHFHDLPVLCDASHIAGDREFIEEIAQEALDLNMNGLMIETHINPASALSDASQQITPEQLKKLLDTLIFRSPTTDNSEFLGQMEVFRRQIDSIDAQLIELLGKRMQIAREIGKYKQKNNVTIFQLRRWENIIATRLRKGKSAGLSKDFIFQLLQLVHNESIRVQTRTMNEK